MQMTQREDDGIIQIQIKIILKVLKHRNNLIMKRLSSMTRYLSDTRYSKEKL